MGRPAYRGQMRDRRMAHFWRGRRSATVDPPDGIACVHAGTARKSESKSRADTERSPGSVSGLSGERLRSGRLRGSIAHGCFPRPLDNLEMEELDCAATEARLSFVKGDDFLTSTQHVGLLE